MQPDIEARIRSDFGEDSGAAISLMHAFLAQRFGSEDAAGCNRLARCIVYLAAGDMTALCDTVDLAEKDMRDVIWSAEYDNTEERRRDLTRPFDS